MQCMSETTFADVAVHMCTYVGKLQTECELLAQPFVFIEFRTWKSQYRQARILVNVNIEQFNLSHSMGKFSRRQTDDVFFFIFFPQITGFDISCKLSKPVIFQEK